MASHRHQRLLPPPLTLRPQALLTPIATRYQPNFRNVIYFRHSTHGTPHPAPWRCRRPRPSRHPSLPS